MQKIQPYGQTVTVNNLGNVAAAPSVQVGNPIGQGLGQIGQAVTQLGGQAAQDTTSEMQLNREAFKIQEQQANEAAKLSAVKSTSDLELQFMQSMPERMNSAQGAATGFTKQLLSDYETQFQQIKETNNNPEAQKFLEYQYLQQRESLARQGVAFEQQRFVGYKVDQLSGTIDNSANVLLIDPNRYIAEKAKTYATIQASGLDEPTQRKLKEQADTQYRNSAANSMLDNNPVAFANMINPTIGKLPEGSIQSKVATIAQQGGISALYALSVTGIESGFNTKSKSKTSSASGLVQMTKSTREQLGLPDNATPEQQIQAFTQLTNNNKLQLQSNLGREPSDQELYLAHHFGASGATNLLNANPDTKISDVVSKEVMAANSYLKGKTVGQVIDTNYKKFTSESKKYLDKEQQAIGAHPVIEDMTAQERIQWNSKAQQVIQSRQTQMFNQYDSMAKDQIAMAQDGKVPQQLMQPEQFKSPTEYTTYLKTMKMGADIHAVNNMTPTQEAQLVNTYTPRQEIGYAGDAQRQQELVKAIQAKRSAIQKDPVAWADNNDSEVQKYASVLQTANTPENLLKYDQALIAAQQKQGVQYPQLLRQDQENSIITKLQNSKGMAKVDAVKQLADQYGKDFSLVAGQLQKNKALPSGLTSIMSAPTQYAREQAAIMSDVDIKQLRDSLPDKNAKDIDTQVAKQMTDFYSSFPAAQLSSTTIGDLRDTITKIAYSNVRNGVSVEQATQNAVDMFVGKDKYNFIQNNNDVTVRVPKAMDANLVQNGMQDVIKNLSIDNVGIGNAKTLIDPWNMNPTEQGYLNQIKSNAYWVTNGNETGANLFFKGHDNREYPVLDKSGKIVTKSFNDLITQSNQQQVAELQSKAKAIKQNMDYMQGVMR